MERRLRDVPGTANYLSISPRFVRVLVERGELVPVRVGRRVLFDVRDLDLLIDKLKSQSTSAPNEGLSRAALEGWKRTPVRKRGAA